ncbi:hypothetical protein JKP88DRAFT_281345 [Tribonema minus]|uniref:Uncharacterized protein n=1 Tax=Tribonema minus TaxID=303371 RepID=A0A836CAL7_9STRA|nr:hypothetical protein JKP88DRAFT_281345 [Tribonema minus]
MASDYVSRAPKDILPLDHYDWNLTSADDDGLRDMMQALLQQIWSREWKLVIDPRLNNLEPECAKMPYKKGIGP